MPNDRADELQTAYRRTAVIGAAMMSTLVMYAVVGLAIASTQDPFEGFVSLEDDGLLRNLFLGLSLFQVVAVQIIRGRALRVPDPSSRFPNAKTSTSPQLVSRLVSTSIVTFALAESIAVYGLVLFLLNGKSTDFFVFLGLSLLAFIMFFPKYHQWEQWMRRQQPIT
jgi:F0F1-type ATP synthase membrane subunit c/vacuolar-type H+-ATPase subunit K